MKRVAGFLLLAPVLIGAGLWLLFPQNAARRPPAFAAYRTAILKETKLEADIIPTLAILGSPDLSKPVVVQFAFVPPAVDREALRKQVVALAKVHLPEVPEVQVQFPIDRRTLPPPGRGY